MSTIEKLQAHLATKPVEYRPGFWFKEHAPMVVCADGTTASIQASENHYSTPRTNTGPYTEVEVWLASAVVTEFDYDSEDPSAYVPIEKVVQFIDNHGGFKE